MSTTSINVPATFSEHNIVQDIPHEFGSLLHSQMKQDAANPREKEHIAKNAANLAVAIRQFGFNPLSPIAVERFPAKGSQPEFYDILDGNSRHEAVAIIAKDQHDQRILKTPLPVVIYQDLTDAQRQSIRMRAQKQSPVSLLSNLEQFGALKQALKFAGLDTTANQLVKTGAWPETPAADDPDGKKLIGRLGKWVDIARVAMQYKEQIGDVIEAVFKAMDKPSLRKDGPTLRLAHAPELIKLKKHAQPAVRLALTAELANMRHAFKPADWKLLQSDKAVSLTDFIMGEDEESEETDSTESSKPVVFGLSVAECDSQINTSESATMRAIWQALKPGDNGKPDFARLSELDKECLAMEKAIASKDTSEASDTQADEADKSKPRKPRK